MHPDLYRILFLTAAALLGGIVNSVAGGGGFLVFPTLLQMGLLPIEANATNTVALWPGQMTSIAAYWKDLRKNLRLVVPVVLVATVGGFCGSWTVLHHSQKSFLHLVPYLFLLGSTSFALSGPITRRIKTRDAARASHGAEIQQQIRLPLLLGLLLAVTFYIGYFGAGAGLITMTVLAVSGVERIAEINALKTVITTTANLVAVILFVAQGAVVWQDCWFMMIACGVGGYFGARYFRRVSDRILRPIIIVIGFSVAIWLFFHQGH